MTTTATHVVHVGLEAAQDRRWPPYTTAKSAAAAADILVDVDVDRKYEYIDMKI